MIDQFITTSVEFPPILIDAGALLTFEQLKMSQDVNVQLNKQMHETFEWIIEECKFTTPLLQEFSNVKLEQILPANLIHKAKERTAIADQDFANRIIPPPPLTSWVFCSGVTPVPEPDRIKLQLDSHGRRDKYGIYHYAGTFLYIVKIGKQRWLSLIDGTVITVFDYVDESVNMQYYNHFLMYLLCRVSAVLAQYRLQL